MFILGLSFGYHDSAAALLTEDGIVAAIQEERLSRVKNDRSFPINAINFCLKKAGIGPKDLTKVVYYEDALLKFDRIAASFLKVGVETNKKIQNQLFETIESWFSEQKFLPVDLISSKLNISTDKISFISHHLSHAASAFLLSPFSRATILTIDGVGEKETLTLSIGDEHNIKKISSCEYPHSIGLFYSAFTAFLGFEVNEGEYKVMGMAGFGKPRFYDEIKKLFIFKGDCRIELDQSFFNFDGGSELPYTSKLINWLGEPREPEAAFSADGISPIDAKAGYYADIAASIQLVTEEVLLQLCREALEITGTSNLCLAGGVALNSAANGRIRREIGCDLFIQPAAGDSGTALGAAIFEATQLTQKRSSIFTTTYLGSTVSLAETIAALDEVVIKKYTLIENDDLLSVEVAKLIASGAVIGWVQGGSEWGPRSLGNRSIIAHSGRSDMKLVVNEKIKFREPFRPFAPSVLVEHAKDFFEISDLALSNYAPENFMLSVCPVKLEMQPNVPAITHVDGSARIHLVRAESNPLYYSLIKEFYKLTGIPILLNTSFNLRGEPIVNSAKDAIKTFLWSGMDALVIGRCLILKQEL